MNHFNLLEELLKRAPPSPAVLKKVDDGVRKAVSAVIVVLPLDEARRFGKSGIEAVARHISVMGQPDLKKLLKKWDSHRKVGRDTTITELRDTLVALLNAEIRPMQRPPPAPRRRART